MINITNHENIFGYDVFPADAGDGTTVLQQDAGTWFTILPSLGVSWSRRF
jgi:hypothetical protein